MGFLKEKAEIIIIVIVVIAALVGIIYYNISNKKEVFVYGVAEGSNPSNNLLIEDQKAFKRFLTKVGVEDEINIDHKKYPIKERYDSTYFETKKLGVIVVSEDTSRDYYHEISEVIYNEDRTNATVKYIYKSTGYSGSLSRSWKTCMFVELDGTVTNVDFVLDNSSLEEDKK